MRGPLMMVAANAGAEVGAPGLRLVPFYAVRGEQYTTYFNKRMDRL